MASIKVWQSHEDRVLGLLCQMLTERKLFKVILSTGSLDHLLEEKQAIAKALLNLKDNEVQYFVSTGTASGSTYNINDEKIQIAMKNGTSLDISEIDNPIVNNALASPVHKNYICYLQAGD